MKKYLKIFFFLSILLLSACSVKGNETSKKDGILNITDICFTEVEKKVNGDSMEPLLKQDQSVILFQGYYNCHEVGRGDIIAYDFIARERPLIKRVVALSGDNLNFSDKHLMVNGVTLENSQGQVYGFSESEQKMINLSVIDGKLQKESYLLLGDNINNSLDSRKFGAVNKEDFIGKFEL